MRRVTEIPSGCMNFQRGSVLKGSLLWLTRRLPSDLTCEFEAARSKPPTTRFPGTSVEFREIDWIVVAGQTRFEVVFELVGKKGELTPQYLESRDKYRQGLSAYRDRRWDDALGAFNASLEAMPGDGPSIALINRIKGLKVDPPSGDWDGSWHIEK